MKAYQEFTKTLTIEIVRDKDKFEIHFYKDSTLKEPGYITGRDLSFFMLRLKTYYQIFKAWRKFKR